MLFWECSLRVDAGQNIRSTRGRLDTDGYFGFVRIALAQSVAALPHNCGQTPLEDFTLISDSETRVKKL